MSNTPQDFPKAGFVITAILVLIFIIMALISTAKGTSAFLQDGGGKWLLVIGGVALAVFLIYRITHLRD